MFVSFFNFLCLSFFHCNFINAFFASFQISQFDFKIFCFLCASQFFELPMGKRRRGFGWSRKKRQSQKKSDIKLKSHIENVLSEVGQSPPVSSDPELRICDNCIENYFLQNEDRAG